MRETVLDRFLRYVRIDTQSAEGVDDFPSTRKQFDLLELLRDELTELGLEGVELDKHGYVTATLPANLPPGHPASESVPAVAFLAHVDTSPDVSGRDVKPQVHENYQGGDITLPGDPEQVIREAENPPLKTAVGCDIVTSDGTTLLGADDKAGVAEIMTALDRFLSDPDILHGPIKIAFTPDEEVGRGVDFFDVENFGADFAYTLDGSVLGEIEDETFNASGAVFKVQGINVHPGYAKGKMVNAVRVAADIVSRLPIDMSPETTEKREGYLHPHGIGGGTDQADVKVLIRDFDLEGMEEKARRLEIIRNEAAAAWPGAKIDLEIKESYRNMRLKLDEDPRVVEYAMEAIRRAGLTPHKELIRGGTDGARLCYMGLLTPNIFAGGVNFHSKLEFVPVQWMEAAVETIVQLAGVWLEKSTEA
jgi:tripeptide aminopeptidase